MAQSNYENKATLDSIHFDWKKIPITIRPGESSFQQLLDDLLNENRFIEESKPTGQLDAQTLARYSPPGIDKLADRSANIAFQNAITRLMLVGLDPLQDFKEFGLNVDSAYNATFLAANLFCVLPLMADCLHLTFATTEQFPEYGYEVLCVEQHLNVALGIKDTIDDLAPLVHAILKSLPPGSTSTNELIEPLKYLKSIAAKNTFIRYLCKVTIKRLKKKPLLLSEKAMIGLKSSITYAVESLFREKWLLVPYPRNRTLDLLHCRKTLKNNVIVRPPVLAVDKALIDPSELKKAILSKKLKLYTKGHLLFKEDTGEYGMRLPSLVDVKKAIVRERLGTLHSYDLLVLRVATIEFHNREVNKVPFSNIPYEYLAICRKIYDDSWIDSLIALKLKRLLSGQYSMMGELDMKLAHKPICFHGPHWNLKTK
ncbi:hypothetical protein K493DRAFT_407399 [Basidiobolus meristosporus CBS 931.73]|uniref:Uncharacterized protein n=1 Tax=Basidiobolus meristosporus CBS 931.73 TaxID=1314790 RepID=A0A1Y1YDF6_9FUNG|nr:hypothetical protein K493DRAFT_407399 [Basidiobolus meristosporus CBS 931.73]|eukprot:ORX95998.1 hypothetical protein K493DRAFT_407399 [Basidiobolus meristosporus CBS 931.73]